MMMMVVVDVLMVMMIMTMIMMMLVLELVMASESMVKNQKDNERRNPLSPCHVLFFHITRMQIEDKIVGYMP